MTVKSVHIVDDDKQHRSSLSWFLRTSDDYSVRDYGSAREFLRKYKDTKPAVLLFDVHMPDIDGIELLEIMQRENVLASVVMLTGYGTVSTAMKAVKLGAHDFLEKPFTERSIHVTLDEALSVSKRRFFAAQIEAEREGALSALTKRERHVFDRLVLGETNKMVARKLHITERTVETHRANLISKLGINTLAGLIELNN
ncbi:MAG: response regulator transcription factor [Kordiimonas sp.]